MPSRTARIDLPPIPPSVPVARHLVLELLRSWQAPHDREDAALLVTELVSNVVDHVQGEADLTLELELSEQTLLIAVVDGSSIRPVVRELSQEHPRGRGMRMVASIADRWGADDHLGGKRVWFELRPAGLPPPAIGEGSGDDMPATERNRAMSEPTGEVHAAGEGVSDEEMVETVAGQTDSASENADTAGKDWNGDPSDAPAPTDQA